MAVNTIGRLVYEHCTPAPKILFSFRKLRCSSNGIQTLSRLRGSLIILTYSALRNAGDYIACSSEYIADDSCESYQRVARKRPRRRISPLSISLMEGVWISVLVGILII